MSTDSNTQSSSDEKFYDESGNEIELNDLLRVYHFTGRRKKKYFMYKIAIFEKNTWYGLDVHEREHKYRLAWSAIDHKIIGTQVIARARRDAPDPKFKTNERLPKKETAAHL